MLIMILIFQARWSGRCSKNHRRHLRDHHLLDHLQIHLQLLEV
jgi:hypothetical protein